MPFARSPSTTISQTVNGIVNSTFATVMPKYARARSSRRSRVSAYSYSVRVQRPRIARRAKPASSWRSRASEIGPANGSAIAATTVAPQNSAAKPVDTTRAGRSPAR